MESTLLYPLILILTYIFSALFATAGVGAANTLIPVYYSLGIPFSIAAASGLLLNIFSLSAATANHTRNHNINWRLGIPLLIPAVIMAPVGAMIGIHTPKEILLIIFFLFLSYTIYNLSRTRKARREGLMKNKAGLALGMAAGAMAGFLGGRIGVGGGLIILPVLTFIESDFRKISGTAGFVALFISASGFLSYLAILRGISYLIWAVIIAGGIAGGFTGSYLVNRIRPRNIQILIIAIIAVVAARLLYSILVPYF